MSGSQPTPWITGAAMQAWLGADKITLQAAGSLASVATDMLAAYLERNLGLQTAISEFYDSNGTDYILLNNWPIVAISALSWDQQTINAAAPNTPGFRLDPFNPRKLVFAGYGKLCRGLMNIAVTYSAGYDLSQPPGGVNALPGAITQALQLTGAAIFNSQAADPNLASESTAGVFSGSFYATGVGAVPPGARSLVENYRRVSP